MICSYCQSEQPPYAESCVFCNAPINAKRPTLKEFIHIDQAELPFEELCLFHTYDLLLLLRLVREERTNTYKLMRTVQKAPEGVLIDSDTLTFTETEYRCYTARMRVLEGILIDRMGYKPKRVDDKLLVSLKAKIEND
ncbi:hypothetical protein KHA93_22945 [Bacillus sp. FJAT-49732]|uniref:Uncharacterized protein n=1 Tax=Lederbergia citrisecunda TaxID=2833583 RepID=A0A942TUK7_9BACI|nr:hypothetical protein [Lederbergia citrisecunda]MBS4202464.1 hypothetical protein [Lederbergia citrisecunda]